MGTWGSGVLDDDFARDVYDHYVEAHAAGQPAGTIVQTLQRDFAGSVSDPDEGPLFWLAVAHAQWDCARVMPEVRERVDEIIAQSLGLARWAEAGPRELARRKTALVRFATKIQTPRKQPKRRPQAIAVPFTVGDCLAIELANGQYGAAVVTKYNPGKSSSHILSVVNFSGTTPPDPDVFEDPSWLIVTASPNLTIVKYCVYSDGYRRHAAKYRVICHIDLKEVPPPLTVLIGNWGNVWQHLDKRLREAGRLS
jgi:hypothetical protein